MSRYIFFVKIFSLNSSEPWLTDDLVNEIYERGNDVTVLFFDVKGIHKKGHYKRDKNYDIYVYPLENQSSTNNRFLKKFKFVKSFVEMYAYFFPVILKNKYDVVISFSMFSYFWGFNKVARLKTKNKTKSIAILWDFYPIHMIEIGKLKGGIIGKILYKLEHHELKCFDKICCMTQKSVDFFDQYFPKLSYKEKSIIYLWRKLGGKNNHPVENDSIEFEPDKFYLVFGGQLSKGRGLEFLIQAASIYRSEFSDLVFIVIGNGEQMPHLKKILKSVNLNNFKLVNHVPRNEYLSILEKSHVGLVITQSDVTIPSFPSKTIDYMLMKLPIIACVEESTDYGDIIENKIKCGLYSNANDLKSFVKNIKKLTSNPQLQDEMGNNGRSFLLDEMSVSNVVETILR